MSFVDDTPCQELLKLSVPALMLAVIFGVSGASAQTVIVQSAPMGSALEVTLNGATVATGTANNSGDAVLTVSGRTGETNAQIFIDTCNEAIRVHLVSRGVQPAPSQAGCNRVDVGSVFVIRQITTLVVDISPSPTLPHLPGCGRDQSLRRARQRSRESRGRIWWCPGGSVSRGSVTRHRRRVATPVRAMASTSAWRRRLRHSIGSRATSQPMSRI